MTAYELLKELEKVFPDRLPTESKFNEKDTLVAIGCQKVIRKAKEILETKRGTN